MKRFYIADLHLYHVNILKFENRPFKDIYEQNEVIKKVWNKKVSPEDEVYILGDLSFNSSKEAIEFVRSLNGKKFFITGNHDNKLLNSEEFRKEFVWIKGYYELTDGEWFICLSHYPFLVWNKCHYGKSIQLYGHIHSLRANGPQFPVSENQYNVGYDIIGGPCELAELIEKNKAWMEEIGMTVNPLFNYKDKGIKK